MVDLGLWCKINIMNMFRFLNPKWGTYTVVDVNHFEKVKSIDRLKILMDKYRYAYAPGINTSSFFVELVEGKAVFRHQNKAHYRSEPRQFKVDGNDLPREIVFSNSEIQEGVTPYLAQKGAKDGKKLFKGI